VNLRDLELGPYDEGPEGHRFHMRPIGGELGAKQTGTSIYEIGPGQSTWPYHWEVGPEELLIVISGELTLRTPDGERVLRAGDVASFPAGPGGAHAVRNHGTESARFLMSSTIAPYGDAVVYPDSGKFAIGGEIGWWHRGFLGDMAEYWEGEP
jgi:uncharacterized cupin superfamily protein